MAFPHIGCFLTLPPTDVCIRFFSTLSDRLTDVPFQLHWKGLEVCLFAVINDGEAILQFSLGLGRDLCPTRDPEAGLTYGRTPHPHPTAHALLFCNVVNGVWAPGL